MVYYVNAGSVYALGIMFPVICTALVLLRFKARKIKNARYGPDDWMSVVALVFTIALGVMMIIGAATHTIGWHSPTQTAKVSFSSINAQNILISKLQYAFFPLSVLAVGFVRLTFVLLYRRIFRGAIFSFITWTVIGVIICWMFAFAAAFFFQCGSHFKANWISQAQYAEFCSDDFDISAGMAVADVAIDLVIFFLPVWPVWQLHMPTHRKLFVIVVFALGIFSIAAGTARMVLFVEVLNYDFGSSNKLFGLAGTADPVGIISVGIWWTYLEIGVGCLVSNLPTLVGLFKGGDKNPLSSIFARISLHSLRSNRSNMSNRSAERDYNDEESQAYKIAGASKERPTSSRESS